MGICAFDHHAMLGTVGIDGMREKDIRLTVHALHDKLTIRSLFRVSRLIFITLPYLTRRTGG